MKKRLTAWAMSAAMCLCQLIPSGLTAYADDYNSVTVTAKITGSAATDLSPGEKFYVDVSLDDLSTCAFSLNASWDTGDLELTDAVPGSNFYNGSILPFTYIPFDKSSGTPVPEQALKDYRNNITRDVCVFAFVSGENMDCGGVAVTLEFTVKPGADIGSSEINVYLDPDDPPRYFSQDYKSVSIGISEGIDDEHNGRVSAEIISSEETVTSAYDPSVTEAFPSMTEITKSLDPAFVTEIITDDNAPFTTITVDASEDDIVSLSPDIENVNSPAANGNDNFYNGLADDVSAAAGASDKAGENIKRIAISCTAVLAAGLIVLMMQKQKRKNNGSDRIK
ncbi:MAG: hypothetical protein J1F11_00525 [Oscillospiraceae bacterium]|nr:hypothetical protein [Oscillospiraceae bacterium]